LLTVTLTRNFNPKHNPDPKLISSAIFFLNLNSGRKGKYPGKRPAGRGGYPDPDFSLSASELVVGTGSLCNHTNGQCTAGQREVYAYACTTAVTVTD